MESVYRLSVLLNLVDHLSGPIGDTESRVNDHVKKMDAAFGKMQQAGAAMVGVGAAITGVGLATVASTFDTQDALGELASLGVQDLQAVEQAAKNFSDTWAGTTKADFVAAAYDIKSGIASLSDEGVAQFTQLAALTGKATKSTTEEMGSLFSTGYGIYKGAYEDMSDLEFGELFSAGIATAVKNYKTSGSQMASAISVLGATATNANVPLEEQLAIMGQLQTTMSGSEAATKYKAFLNAAASAGDKLGLTFMDSNNQLLSMPEILTELRGKYGDTIDAVEKQQLKEAFGTDEAVALIDLLYNNVDTLNGGIQDLQASMTSGVAVTEEMAQAIQNTPAQKFQVLKQQIHNNVEELGKGLLPMVNQAMDRISALIQRGSDWISNNQETVQTIMTIVMQLGVLLVVVGGVIGVIGTVGKAFLAARNAILLVKTGLVAAKAAFLATPAGWIVAAIVGVIAAFVLLWNKSEAFRQFWMNLFNGVKGALSSAMGVIRPALENLGAKFGALRTSIQPLITMIGTALVPALTVGLSYFMGMIHGAIAAIGPLINAFSNLIEFVTNIVNAIVALFQGNFSGAMEFAKAAVGNLGDFFTNIFQAVLSFLGGFIEGVKSTFQAGFDAIKGKVSSTMEGVASAVNNHMQAAASFAQGQLSNMQAAFQASGGGIRGVASATMAGVKGIFSAGYSAINTLTGGRLEAVRTTISNKLNAAKTAVTSILDSIKSAFSSKLEAARSAVSNAINRIKSCFKFSWSLPKLKLPHISISGSFSLSPPSVPKFGISWHKHGGIMTGPTIFGAIGSTLLGGGEAGHEAILPLAELWKQMRQIVGDIIQKKNDESRAEVSQAGASLSRIISEKRESKETTDEITREQSQGNGKGVLTIGELHISVDITKLKDLPLLFELVNELKDAQNQTGELETV